MMCSCEPPSFVCSRCAGDLKQDWRMLQDGDPPDLEQRERDELARAWMVQQRPAVKT